ncbi:hypothetical protein [Rosenbergiella nectarea]|uniref:hypothetical protein n=1 Tax=Rosenbergiella nectarea TaxID=988801 RepID=UPI001BDAC171|nr:hypothetical protein [Rosenbergiella nectarea]MBT0731464.1 hypothetical protein [Rosenbergiella nectarea subsp. apis]
MSKKIFFTRPNITKSDVTFLYLLMQQHRLLRMIGEYSLKGDLMPKIISIVPEVEIVFSLPRGKILENKSIIYLLAQYIGATVKLDDINRAQLFSIEEEMKDLVLIINHSEFTFLTDQEFEKKSLETKTFIQPDQSESQHEVK